MLVLAFDTATEVATSALVRDGELLGERMSVARTLLVDVDALLHDEGLAPGDLEGLVVGTGPGSFTSIRIGLAVARGLAVAVNIPAAGVSTLAALEAGAEGAFPVIDARRGEVFISGPRAVPPEEVDCAAGAVYVGDGAVRYRAVLEANGAKVPPDSDPLHVPRAVHHARLAREFGSVDATVPIYVRAPDAKPAT